VYIFKTITGEIFIDQQKCLTCLAKPCLKVCPPQILKEEEGRTMLAIDEASVEKGKCVECLACELVCTFEGNSAIKIILPLPKANS
jgi:Fe-S-cluster-containing hydrogenase component 2